LFLYKLINFDYSIDSRYLELSRNLKIRLIMG